MPGKAVVSSFSEFLSVRYPFNWSRAREMFVDAVSRAGKENRRKRKNGGKIDVEEERKSRFRGPSSQEVFQRLGDVAQRNGNAIKQPSACKCRVTHPLESILHCTKIL